MRIDPVAATVGLVAVAAAILWGRHDYKRWVSLGPGGLPHSFRGWVRLSRYRLMMRDPFDTAMYPCADDPAGGPRYLRTLPKRGGPRPKVAPYPIPHRQLNQYGGTHIRRELDAMFDATVQRHGGVVLYKLSYFEKHTPAVTLLSPGSGHADARASCGEVGHIHPFDGSMHMIFSAADARTVIESGWGERHPLAGVVLGIPRTYLFIYPPRDALELQVVGQLIGAAIAHLSGGKAPDSLR